MVAGRLHSQSALKDVLIMGAARTPVGSFRGALASQSAPALGATAIKGALKRAQISADRIDEAIMGNVLSACLGQAPARQAALQAGLPESTVCTTVNKVCASGLKAVMFGAQSIALGLHHTVVAGGMESMSNSPYYLDRARQGYNYGHQHVWDSIIKDGLWCSQYQIHMGECAEETASARQISREEQDAYAAESYRRAQAATAAGNFKAEIEGVSVPGRGKDPAVLITTDEECQRVDFAKIPSLKSVFVPGGTITAANASTINDGASAVVLMHASQSEGRKPIGRIIAMADAECNPKLFTVAPAKVVPILLERAGLRAEQIDRWEINEAFSVVALANMQLLGLDAGRVNMWGGGGGPGASNRILWVSDTRDASAPAPARPVWGGGCVQWRRRGIGPASATPMIK